MSVTIKEIALAAGVSRGTVDRVLHNRSGVNPEVAEQVRRIAEKLGFTPNRAGRILASRKQPISIGCLLPDKGNPFFDDVTAGFVRAQDELKDFGVTVHTEHLEGFTEEDHIAAIQRLAAGGFSGLCLATMDTPQVQLAVQTAIQQGMPVISVNTDIPDTGRICYIGPDYFQNGRAAAGMLRLMLHTPCLHSSLQHLCILPVTGSYHIHGHNERIKGFLDGLNSSGIRYTLLPTVESQDSNEQAYRQVRQHIQSHPELNCIFNAAAGVQGVCRAVNDTGRTDIQVLSFDAVPQTVQMVRSHVIPFTICQEPERQGYMAVVTMFNYLIDDKKTLPEDCITQTIIKIAENI